MRVCVCVSVCVCVNAIKNATVSTVITSQWFVPKKHLPTFDLLSGRPSSPEVYYFDKMHNSEASAYCLRTAANPVFFSAMTKRRAAHQKLKQQV